MDGKCSNDENEVSVEVKENEIREDHSETISEYVSSLDLPIALKKGTGLALITMLPTNVSYENLSPQSKTFTASLNST